MFGEEKKEEQPELEVVHESHNMRQFSDVPYGCWSCGACSCHHMELLIGPCKKGIKQRGRTSWPQMPR